MLTLASREFENPISSTVACVRPLYDKGDVRQRDMSLSVLSQKVTWTTATSGLVLGLCVYSKGSFATSLGLTGEGLRGLFWGPSKLKSCLSGYIEYVETIGEVPDTICLRFWSVWCTFFPHRPPIRLATLGCFAALEAEV